MKSPRQTMRYSLLALVMLCVSAANAQRSRFTPAVLRDTILENGLQVIAVRNPTSPMATVMVAVRGGAITQDNPMAEGIPHFLEHMLFKSSSSFGAEVSAIEGGYNGTTSEELVNYFVTVPAKGVPGGIKALANLVRSPKFRIEDMTTEVQVVRNELERRAADQRFLLDFSVNQQLWGADWTRKNVGGTVFALLKSTPASLEATYKEYYTPNNAALIVSGDIDLAEVIATAKEAFKGWKKGPDVSKAAAAVQLAPLAATKVVSAVDGTGSDITLRVAWRGPSVGADSIGATSASLFSAWLNNRNSEFQRQLVDGGLFQSVSIHYDLLNHVGPIELTARTTPSKFVEATAALQRELGKLSDPKAFTETDLALARKYWRVDAATDWERGPAFAHEVAAHWSVAGLKSFVDYGDRIAARSTDDVRAFIQSYISGKPRVVGILINSSARTAMGREYQLTMGTW